MATKYNLRLRYGSYPLASASIDILFKFLVNHMAFVTHKKDEPGFKDLAACFASLFEDRTILNLRNDIRKIYLDAITSKAAATIKAAGIYYRKSYNEEYPYCTWFFNIIDFNDEEVKKNCQLTLNNGNVNDFLGQINFKVKDLIEKINNMTSINEEDTTFISRLRSINERLNCLLSRLTLCPYPKMDDSKMNRKSKDTVTFRVKNNLEQSDKENESSLPDAKKDDKKSYAKILELNPQKSNNEMLVKVKIMEKNGHTYCLREVLMKKSDYNNIETY